MAFDTFFGEWLPDEMVVPQPIPPEQCEYFRPMVGGHEPFVALGDAMEALPAGAANLAFA